jgi:branched-chain amino acid aminotransferase
MSRKVWFNGDIIPERGARLSIYDSALMFGDMVFEMTRSFNGKQFKLREHLERLIRSANYFQIQTLSLNGLEEACHAVQEANQFEPDDEHRLMINVSRGTLPMYSDTGRIGTNVIISDFPLRWTVAGMGKLFETGLNAVIPSQRAIPASLLEPSVKCRSRAHLMMANMEVSKYEGENNWPLLLGPDGYITEGTGANFFIVKHKRLATPKSNLLCGISRQFLFSQYAVLETDILPYDVYNADEAFFTATPFCMLPVTYLNGIPIGDGTVGPYYKRLLKEWSTNVDVDIKGQIQAWDKGVKEGPSAYKFK